MDQLFSSTYLLSYLKRFSQQSQVLIKVIDRVLKVGSGLLNKGIESSNLNHIGIYSSNRTDVNSAILITRKLCLFLLI
jgi:hypothetical protein